MKVVHNDDGTVTVTIPKTDEVYEPATGDLHVAETLSAEDFAEAVRPPKRKNAAPAEG